MALTAMKLLENNRQILLYTVLGYVLCLAVGSLFAPFGPYVYLSGLIFALLYSGALLFIHNQSIRWCGVVLVIITLLLILINILNVQRYEINRKKRIEYFKDMERR